MLSKWIRKILGGLSLTSALFVFQACYGTPQDFALDALLEGHVKSSETGHPIKGIRVMVDRTKQFQLTDENGQFSFYTSLFENEKIRFEDVDGTENASFFSKDTLVRDMGTDKLTLNVNLEKR